MSLISLMFLVISREQCSPFLHFVHAWSPMVLLTNNFVEQFWNFSTQFARHFITERPHFLKISNYNSPILAQFVTKRPLFYVNLIYHWRHLYVTEGPPSLGHSIHWNEWIFHFKLIKFNFKQFINFMQFLILTTNV